MYKTVVYKRLNGDTQKVTHLEQEKIMNGDIKDKS